MIRWERYKDGQLVDADLFDTETNTYSRELDGQIVETRPLTADEVAQFTPSAPVVTPEEKLAAAKVTLASLDALPSPVLTADVVDLLDDLRSVL